MEIMRYHPIFKLLSCIIAICILFTLFLAVVSKVNQVYLDAHGVTAAVEGTVSNKQYIAAHTDTQGFLFYSSSTFCPDEYKIEIRRYDTAKSKWETATYDIDKATFDKLNVGDHYKDALNRTAYFQFNS